MIFIEALRSGWQAILANRLRSILTTLGIMIGVAAVIILVAFGQGASNSVTSSIQSLGSNLLYVTPENPNRDGEIVNPSVQELTVDDAIALNDPVRAPDVAGAAPERRTAEEGSSSRRQPLSPFLPPSVSSSMYILMVLTRGEGEEEGGRGRRTRPTSGRSKRGTTGRRSR